MPFASSTLDPLQLGFLAVSGNLTIPDSDGTMSRFDNILGIHEQALPLRSQRMDILAQNLANTSTPNFKAKDLDFRRVLAEENSSIIKTHARHASRLDPVGNSPIVYRVPMSASMDRNTVEAHVEQAKFGEAALQYDATLRFLEKRISGIRKALKGE